MTINVYSGTIQTLGASTTANGTLTTYSYIEMSDGQMIKNLRIGTALNGELHSAFDEGKTVELYAEGYKSDKKDIAHVFAIRLENGRAFSDHTISTPWGAYLWTFVFGFLAFFGFVYMLERHLSQKDWWGLFFFIIGILLTWFFLKHIRCHKQKNKHSEALNPIYIN